jgi:colanic acid/amylovoran biosynthesis glycosyltransferase
MRLGYLTSQYPAASHTFIRREIEALRELGWQIDTFSVRPPGDDETQAEADRSEALNSYYVLRQRALAFVAAHLAGIFTAPAGYFRTFALALGHRAPGARGFLLALAHFAESVILASELRKRNVHHVHNHFANSAATVGLLATRMLGIGWSFTMHGISETDYPAGLMLGRKIEVADFVACVSWFGRAQGMRLVAPEHWNKMLVVRCGLPLDRLPSREPQDRNERSLICVGRLSPEKGQAGLLQALGGLRASQPGVKLRLVGDGPERPELEKLVSELQLGDRVTFLGRLTETDTLAEIARSDILVLPSFMEGLPIVLMEAMALGVPVIASRVAGIPELVEDGRGGLLFAPSKWDELADCIRRLLTDQALYGSLAEHGKKKVADEFNAQKSAEVLTQLFTRVSRE